VRTATIGVVATLVAAWASAQEYRVDRASEPAPRTALMAAADAGWYSARRTSFGPEPYRTTFSAIWSDDGLFVRFDAVDPQPWHTKTRRDDSLWDEEVVEIFLDPGRRGRDYAELEISPANVVTDVRMAQPWPDKQMDLGFDLAGLETRVHPMRDGGGRTIGWTAVAFIPWSAFRSLPSAAGVRLPPRPDDRWRFNVFRIERPGGPQAPEKDAVFAALSDPGGESFHVPAAFRDLVFAPAR
jgi:Carbohydrate family 9 binding domain-like